MLHQLMPFGFGFWFATSMASYKFIRAVRTYRRKDLVGRHFNTEFHVWLAAAVVIGALK